MARKLVQTQKGGLTNKVYLVFTNKKDVWMPLFEMQRTCKLYFCNQRVFSSLAKNTRRNNIRGIQTDPKHIFTDPKTNEIKKPPTFFVNQQENNVIAHAIEQSMRAHRRTRQKVFFSAMLAGIIGVTLGYSVGYKVLYSGEESFIPLYPSRRWHRLSEYDSQRINMEEMKVLGKMRCLSILTNHPMIREKFGVPLRTEDGKVPQLKSFDVWCEDQDPCVQGIIVKPIDQNDRKRFRKHSWHRIPGLFEWRMGSKPIIVHGTLDSFLKYIGVYTGDLFQVMNPDRVYGEFKYEFPLKKAENGDNFDSDDDRSMHIWFFGEIDLGDNSMVVFKGKYHVTVKMEQVDLLEKEGDQLVRYMLYKDGNNKS